MKNKKKARTKRGEERKKHEGSERELRDAERKHVHFLSGLFTQWGVEECNEESGQR